MAPAPESKAAMRAPAEDSHPATGIDFPVVAIASSAGGIRALGVVLAALPADLPAAVVVVQHIAPLYRSMLAQILGEHCALPVMQAGDGQRLQVGRIYVAAPGRHLVVNLDGSLTLSMAAPVHFVRPAADLLFISVAAAFATRAIAVVLSGSGRDGEAGVLAVKQGGGKIIAQDEATSEYFGMPGSAIRTGEVDFVLPLDQIASMIVKLVRSEAQT
jgi:two-component system chemotaxis response regulator CheB